MRGDECPTTGVVPSKAAETEIGMRECRGKRSCGRLLPLSSFSSKGKLRGRVLHETQCKTCRAVTAKSRYARKKCAQSSRGGSRKSKVLDLNNFYFVEVVEESNDDEIDQIFAQVIEAILWQRNQK